MKKLGNYQPSSSVQKQFRLLTCFCCFSTFFQIWKNFRVLVQALETHLDSFQPSYRDFNNKLHKVSVVLRQIQSFKLLKTVWFGITSVAFLIFSLFFWKFSLIEELTQTIFQIFENGLHRNFQKWYHSIANPEKATNTNVQPFQKYVTHLITFFQFGRRTFH